MSGLRFLFVPCVEKSFLSFTPCQCMMLYIGRPLRVPSRSPFPGRVSSIPPSSSTLSARFGDSKGSQCTRSGMNRCYAVIGHSWQRTLSPFEWGIIWHAIQSLAISPVRGQVPSRSAILSLNSESEECDKSVLPSIASGSTRRGCS